MSQLLKALSIKRVYAEMAGKLFLLVLILTLLIS